MAQYFNGENDGVACFYVKDGVLYPLVLNKEKQQMISFVLGNELTILDEPLSYDVYVLKGKKETKNE